MSEKNITSLNQLKNWFKTGLKPTQAQFWAWLDSFYHKDEDIPQDKISGLSESLETKADTTAVEAKANADASGLSGKQKQAWKEALEVGELPTNIALIDENGDDGNKQGNVHTKEQITKLLENSGRNLGNTDLQVPSGEVRTLDVTGAKLQLKGLESKASDRSFSRKLKTNERGEIAYSEEVDVVNNINVSLPNPMSVRIQADTPSWVQHQLSEPNISEDMRRLLQRIEGINNNSGFTLYSSDEIVVNSLPLEKYPTSLQSGSYRLPNIIVANGLIRNDRSHSINTAFRNQEYINNLESEGYSLFYNIIFNKELPTNKDWIVSWRTHFYTDLINQFLPDRGGNNKNLISSLGFRNNTEENIYQAQLSREERFFHTASHFSNWLDTSGKASGGVSVGSPLSQFYFIKTGNLLTLMKVNQETGRVEISTVQYKDTYKYFSIESVISPHNVVVNDFMLKDISYWIEP